MKHILVLLLLTIFITTVGICAAAEFIPLGGSSGDNDSFVPRSLSDDGSVVVGSRRIDTGCEKYIWTAETGMMGLGFDDMCERFAHQISGDGTTVVGGSNAGSFLYTESGGLQEIPIVGHATSFDGSIVVGSDQGRVSRWTLEGGVTRLGTVDVRLDGNLYGEARDVSSDGTVIVGISRMSDLNRSSEAFRWTAETGMVGLGDLTGGDHSGGANAVTADGSTVVGGSDSGRGFQAFRWNEQAGMVGLDWRNNLIEWSVARGVTDDGDTIVGYDVIGLKAQAFIWSAQNGTQDLFQVLSDEYGLADSLAGWDLTSAQNISPDGQFIVGRGFNPDGNREGWLVRLAAPEPLLLSGGGETYLEYFDSIGTGKSMPKGWSGDIGEGFTRRTASLGLVDGPLAGPLDDSPGTAAGLLNLGGSSEHFEGSAGHLATWQRGLVRDGVLNEADMIKDAAEDRALGIGRVDENDPGRLQFEIQIGDAPLRAFTLDWDLEVWGGDPDTTFRGTDGGGFAAELTIGGETYYEATVSHKPGELFSTNWDGADTRYNTTLIDGNIHSVRGNTSGIVEVNTKDGAVGNTINLTFDANFGSNDKGWISAIDNVQLRALAPGDVDANGVVDVADLLTLLGGQKFNKGVDGVTWAQGDFNADDQFNTGDLLTMLAFLSGQFPSDPYASEAGNDSDEMADVIVNSVTGEITIDLAGHTASAILIESAAEIFNGSKPDWDTTSQFPSTLPGELGNVLFTSTTSGIDELGVVISSEFLGRDKEFYLQDLDLNILIASEGGALTKGNVIVVPEPSTWAPTMVGLLGLLVVARRRNLL